MVEREGGFDLDSSDSSSRLSHTHTHQPTVTFLSSILNFCSTLFFAVSGMLSARVLTKITSDRSFWSWSSRFPQMLVPLVLVRGPLLLLQYWASPARRGWRGDPTRFYSDTIPSNSNYPVPVRLLIHSVVVIAFQISYQRFASLPPTRTI